MSLIKFNKNGSLLDCKLEPEGHRIRIISELPVIGIKQLIEEMQSANTPKWLEVDKENATAKVIALPKREDVDFDFNEQLIVELYSK